MNMPNPVDFDDYADRYEQMLQDQLAFFSNDRGYFSEYKVELARTICQPAPQRVLDFGCGIGLSLPYLQRYFSNATIFASDLSRKSLDYVAQNWPDVSVLRDDELDDQRFDLIFISGVIHHVPPTQREVLFERLGGLLSPQGRLIVFDHNPFNPVTRHMVSTCPFDEDAVLLRLSAMKQLVRGSAGLSIKASGYCLFFPQALRFLRPTERLMTWLPMGGQYFVMAQK